MGSKRATLLIAASVIVLIMLAAFGMQAFLDGQTAKQNTPSPNPTTSKTNQPNPTPTAISQIDYSGEVQKIFNQAIQKMEQLRNITIPQVNLQIVTKEWAIQTWGVATAQSDLIGIQRQENIYKALLMIPQNASLYQATVDWAGYFMAAAQAGTIYIIQENFNITNSIDAEATLAHELTHILPISYNIPQHYSNFDSSKARAALTEGDATFTAKFIKNQTLEMNRLSPEPNISNQKNLLTNNPSKTTVNPSIPDSIYNLDYFPYKYGEKFIQALYDQGGWQTINQAYKNPPNSTEQVLHPEKYFTAELPESVADTLPAEGNWTKAWGAQYGEFFIQNMLSTHLTQSEAEKASTGWDGDRLAYFENPNGQYLITWNIKWDTYNDAGEFFLAFNAYMKNAGAQENQFSHWQTNQIQQEIIWDQSTNSTLITASVDQNL
jgi:hypothetical protein